MRMRRLLLVTVLLIALPSIALAQLKRGSGGSIAVQESDGSPSVSGVTGITVTNGSLTDNGDGTVTVATSGASNVTIGSSAISGGTVGGSLYVATGPVLQQLTGSGLMVLNSLSAPTVYGGATCTNQVLRILGANGAGTCATITSSYVDTSIWTGTVASGMLKASSQGVLAQAVSGTDYVVPAGNVATATALAANGANCSAGQFPLGVNASGASETCTALPTTISGTANEITASASTGAITLSLPSSIDLGAKALEVPNSTIAGAAATCNIGQIYFATDATVGQNMYGCTSSNTWTLLGDGGGGGSGYATIQNEGAALTQRSILNLTGAGVDCADNAGSTRTDCTVSAPTHTLLDGLTHTDTTAGVPGNGDLIISDTNMWAKLSGPTSASERCFVSTGTGAAANVPTWSACSGVTANTGASPAIAATDNRKVVTYTNASPVAATIAQAGTTGFATGWYSYHRNVGSTVVTITPTTSTIGGLTTLVLDPGEGALIVSDGTNYQVMRGGSTSSINAQTGVSYTISRDDANNLVTTSNAGAIATTLPQATTAGFGKGFSTFVKNIGVGTNTITPTTSTINGAASLALTTNQWAVIFSDGANYTALKGSDSGGGGAGTVTNTGGSLTANAVVLGAGTDDTKVVAGVTTDGTSILNLGVAGASTGKVVLSNTTSGTITITPPAGALGTVTTTIPATTGTLALNSPSYLTTSAESTLSGENVLTAGKRVSVTTTGGTTTLEHTPSTQFFSVEDELCGGTNANGSIGNTGLYSASGTLANVSSTASHPCIINMTAAIGNLARVFFTPFDATTAVMGDVQKMTFIIRPQSLDADTSIRCGFLTSNGTTLEGSDGVYMSYLNSASANWRAITQVGAVKTATSSGVAAGSGTWVQFDITRNGSNWDFSLNEAAAFATPATTTGPASTTGGKIGCVIDALTATKNFDLDYLAWSTINPLGSRHP